MSTETVRESDTVTILRDGDRTFYIVGTAHVSEASVAEVRRTIEEVQPDAVCIELCKARYDALTEQSGWRNLDVFRVIREGKTLFLLANMAIGAYQRRLGEALGVRPGAELLAAARAAEEVGARVELVDRDIHVTLKRTWGNLRFRDKVALLGAIMGGLVQRDQVTAADIESLKEKAHLSEMLAEFAKALPQVKGPLIDERDQYLMSSVETTKGQTIVAVVGAAHVPGMQQHFGKPVDMRSLKTVPPRSGMARALKWLFPLIVMVIFAVALYRKDWSNLSDLLFAWILPNSIMASLLTAIGGGKILSIVTAAVASPVTSLNPLVPAGLVVGLLEAWLRKPTVQDCENINRDVHSLRGLYRNQATRVLLVAVMATFGSALGAWVGLGWLVALLR